MKEGNDDVNVERLVVVGGGSEGEGADTWRSDAATD